VASEQLQGVITLLRDMRAASVDLSLEEERARTDGAADIVPPPPGVTFEPVDAAGVAAEWSTPAEAVSDAVVLYFHGGAYAIGSPRSHRGLTARIALATGVRVLSVDYRMAPEHPFPAAVDDAVASYRWLVASGIAPARIAIAGDSAGGGLTVALLVALRDAGDALPAAAAPISPWTDLTLTADSWRTRAAGDPMLTHENLTLRAAAYLAGTDAKHPLASPLFADLRGLPPLLINVGDAECLLDDSTALAERARAAGVDVTIEVFPEMIHVFHLFAGIIPEADDAVEKLSGWLAERLGV
jgi:phosphinothricin tripeptide acetyl hydrolase